MSESENEAEAKRMSDVGELNEILDLFDAAGRKTSVRGVKESLGLARAVASLNEFWLVRGRNRMKMTMSP